MNGLLGKKLGMIRHFSETGEAIPCTVIEAGPCRIVQVKTKERDGYNAIQLGFGNKPERLVNKPLAGHFKKNDIAPSRVLREFRDEPINDIQPGSEITVENVFSVGDNVKVISASKGRGFQGVVKRHHFGGGLLTHGQSDRVRAPGSIGSSSYPSRVFKGMRMAGRMGGTRTTVKNLTVIKIIPESNLILVKGSVPGYNSCYLEIQKEKK
jgi:large subunit ribosomal protein L3